METQRADTIKLFEYGKSFLMTKDKKVNNPRFLIDSMCTIIDGDQRDDYYLCAPCKGEHTFAKSGLFEEKTSFEFTPLFNNKEVLVFRKFTFFNNLETGEYKKAYMSKDMWGGNEPFIKKCKIKEKLDTSDKIVSATKKGNQIIGELIVKEDGIKKYAIIYFPVKTINLHKKKWQIDTGPIPIPILTIESPYRIFSFEMAYLIFNNFKFIDIAIMGLKKLTKDYLVVGQAEYKTIYNPEIYLYSL